MVLADSLRRPCGVGSHHHPDDKGVDVALGLVAPAAPLVPDWLVGLAFFANAAAWLAVGVYLTTRRST